MAIQDRAATPTMPRRLFRRNVRPARVKTEPRKTGETVNNDCVGTAAWQAMRKQGAMK